MSFIKQWSMRIMHTSTLLRTSCTAAFHAHKRYVWPVSACTSSDSVSPSCTTFIVCLMIYHDAIITICCCLSSCTLFTLIHSWYICSSLRLTLRREKKSGDSDRQLCFWNAHYRLLGQHRLHSANHWLVVRHWRITKIDWGLCVLRLCKLLAHCCTELQLLRVVARAGEASCWPQSYSCGCVHYVQLIAFPSSFACARREEGLARQTSTALAHA